MGGEGKNLLEEAGDKVHSAASATGEKAQEAYDAAAAKVCCLLHVPSAACGPSCLLVHETLRVVLGLGSLDSSVQLATQAAELQREAKEKAEHETKKADAKAASPGAARLSTLQSHMNSPFCWECRFALARSCSASGRTPAMHESIAIDTAQRPCSATHAGVTVRIAHNVDP